MGPVGHAGVSRACPEPEPEPTYAQAAAAVLGKLDWKQTPQGHRLSVRPTRSDLCLLFQEHPHWRDRVAWDDFRKQSLVDGRGVDTQRANSTATLGRVVPWQDQKERELKMKRPSAWIRTAAIVVAALMPSTVLGETVTVPFGTAVFCELDQKVTSKKKKWSEGDLVKAHVWKDVRVGAHVVIKAGTPVMVQVSELQSSRIAGQKGSLELSALNVVGVDGVGIPLDGGYDKSGKGMVGLSVALGVVVFAPLIFIKGKQAILERGTIFDAMVRNPTDIEVDTATNRPVLRVPPTLKVTVLYDEIDMDAQTVLLPMSISAAQPFERVEVVAINSEPLAPPLQFDMVGAPVDGAVKVTTPWNPFAQMMSRGMNRLSVKVGEETVEVLLEIEL